MNTHPTTATALCSTLEFVINNALQYDPATQQRLTLQAGRCVCLMLVEPNITLSIHFRETGITVSPIAEETADCTLSGKSSGLMQLMSGPKTSLAGSELTLNGQTGFLMELLDITKQIDIDWEAIICQYLGDVAGHTAAQAIRYKSAYLSRLYQRAPHFTQTLLTEELRAVPSTSELNAFNNDVDDLRDDAERLKARIDLMQQALTQ